jgi:hypothetical protein
MPAKKEGFTLTAVISQKTNDEPKIYPTSTGARVEFELYDISLDQLRSIVGEELTVTITNAGS